MHTDFSLTDAYRSIHPSTVSVTWRGFGVACRLDRVYISRNLLNEIVSFDVCPCSSSDHDYIVVVLNIGNGIQIGEGFWKINNSILNDRAYVSLFTNFWQKNLTGKIITLDFWEKTKTDIQNLTKQYCKKKARIKQKVKFDLDRRFRILTQAESRSPGHYGERIEALKKQLYSYQSEEAQGACIRSRALKLDDEEKSARFFQKRENFKSSNRIIQNLEDKDGNLSKDMP